MQPWVKTFRKALTNAFGGSVVGLLVLLLIILMVWYFIRIDFLNRLKQVMENEPLQ